MTIKAPRKKTPVSMQFRDDDLTTIDRGAQLLGLSRTEFMRRAAPHEAQTAIPERNRFSTLLGHRNAVGSSGEGFQR
ncbi:DUF1778 domain-containing protein [Mesorhizobium waimense]|uniref:DUF1778 domain-containing protein n=1 Tax=Mesorhizobium waimense TaxID=1300307 RepID=A0A3A5K096_9HYPH|nr:DUF1778 domain-containing protein [Mesorhizobium waimense]RJT24065.1 DUF1778 domain-containing protein [Mesorhizobium waimense]